MEIPAVTREVSVKKKDKDQTTSSKRIKGKYEVVERQEVVKEPAYKTEVIPAVTKDIVRTVLVKDESSTSTEVAAVYTDVTKRILTKAGGLTVWREVPCTIPASGVVLPINYEVGSAELTRSSLRVIDEKLLARLNEEPNSIVEIGSHTDARGSAEANQRLSERRAKSVVEYLISQGIDKERLLAVGYGETTPINKCVDGVTCSDSQHAQNRRTEFKMF